MLPAGAPPSASCWRLLEDAELTARVSGDHLAAYLARTPSSALDELRPELGAIRAQGWATQDEELAYGLRSVAAPVRGENGTVVARVNLAVQSRDWPAARITRELRPADARHLRADLPAARLPRW